MNTTVSFLSDRMSSQRSSFSSRPARVAMSLVLFLCTALAGNAWADPPGQVGRLGAMNGQVWQFSPDSGEWVTAERNRPLTDGDRIATDADSHADVRIGSTTVRLDAGTELEVLHIDDDHVALQLHNGTIATRLRSAEAAREFELRTGEGRFITNRPGRYRFDRADESSHVTVLSGEAMYEGPGSALTVNSGQRAEFWLENNAAQYAITDPIRDNFAAWSADQDRRDERSASTRYVSPEMTGAEDLDRYGRWEQAPDYGAVWIPQAVPVDWAPYRAGHWAWVSPWGWTWIDDQPWGFAPFHYGRWVSYRDRWCWVPGTYVRRPVYAPALVGWVGGPRVNVSISIGSPGPAVGWFPLAPREVYVPTYRVSPRYVQQVNITHVTNITNITTIVNNPQQAVVNVDYRNRHLPHAVTVVPQTVFVNRQPVMPAALQAQRTPVMQQALLAAQKAVVAAPPVPQPQVDEVRRRHGFAPEGGGRPATAPGAARTPVTASNNLSPAGGGVNIPAPPTHVVAPAARQADGEARARFERRREEGQGPGRGQPVAPNAAAIANPAAPQAQGARAPTPPVVNQPGGPRPVTAAPAAQPAPPQQPARAMSPLEAAQQEALRQQQARQQEGRQQEAGQREAQRAEQQRQQEARRQQDAQRLQDVQKAQQAQRQQAEAQRQQAAEAAQQRQQREAQQRAEQQRQEAARRQQEVVQQRAQEIQRADAQREQETRGGRDRGVPPPPHAQQREAAKPQPEQPAQVQQRPAVAPAQAPRPAEAQEKPKAEPKGKEERAERERERERGEERRQRGDNNR